MPAIAVAGYVRVVEEQVTRGRAVAVGAIADPDGVEDVAAAIPAGRAVRRRLEQVAQGRHRAVVQVGRARPDAVERLVGIAVRLAEMAEAPGIADIERVLRRGEV